MNGTANGMYFWWGKLSLRKRSQLLTKIGAELHQKNALMKRSWSGLSLWVRKGLKKLRAANLDKESWQKLMEDES